MLGNILAVGLMSMGMGLSSVKDGPQMKANAQETITLPSTYTAEQLINLISYYVDEVDETQSVEATGTYTDSGGGSFTSVTMKVVDPHMGGPIKYVITTGPASIGVLSTEVIDQGTATMVFTSYPEEWTYLLAGEQPPQPMGPSIIGSIASGLGIIGALATTFLTGFGHLFYAEGALTPFAIFALVMLGVAVSFAVVKLVLNIIRSNTGA